MIRLTILLLLSTGATLTIAGRDLDRPEGDTATPVVARAETDLTDAMPQRLALDDEKGAFERALAATNAYTRPEPAPEPAMMIGAAAAATAPAPEALPAATVNASRVNLRSGPSTASEVVAQAERNQRVEIINRAGNGWAEIRLVETGRTAFIFDRFLTPQG